MADIAIVYASDREALVSKLASLLEKYWLVWWDKYIVGDFQDAIKNELPNASCVIFVRDKASHLSDVVYDELTIARQNQVKIIPILIEDCDPILGFGKLSYVDFRDWGLNEDHSCFKKLKSKISQVVPERFHSGREGASIKLGFQLPAVFLSVSSFETNLVPLDAVKALQIFGTKTVLISAYDMHKSRRPRGIIKALNQIQATGGKVLVDSGFYESSRTDDSGWTPNHLHEAMERLPHDYLLIFDETHVSNNPAKVAQGIVAAVNRDRQSTSSPVIPIVHASTRRNGTIDVRRLTETVCRVADEVNPELIAIPERETGMGIFESARSIRQLRTEMDRDLGYYQPLHILGTCEPWRVAVLAAAGADSFDGLEWCRGVFDDQTLIFHHMQHFDLFRIQSLLSNNEITQEALSDENISYSGKAVFCNLDVLARFSIELQSAAERGRLEALVSKLLGVSYMNELHSTLPGFFE